MASTKKGNSPRTGILGGGVGETSDLSPHIPKKSKQGKEQDQEHRSERFARKGANFDKLISRKKRDGEQGARKKY